MNSKNLRQKVRSFLNLGCHHRTFPRSPLHQTSIDVFHPKYTTCTAWDENQEDEEDLKQWEDDWDDEQLDDDFSKQLR